MDDSTLHGALRDLDPETTMEALEAFLHRWVGPRQPEYRGDSADMPADTPAALRRLYELAANWPCASIDIDRPLFGGYWPQNILITPEKWERSGGHTVFAWENQGVCSWAFDTDAPSDDPAVMQLGEDGVHQQAESLSSFLVNWCLHEIQIGRWLASTERLEAVCLARPESVELLSDLPLGRFELFDNSYIVHTPSYGDGRQFGLLDLEVDRSGPLFAPYSAMQTWSKDAAWAWRLGISELGGVVVSSQKQWHLRQVLPPGSVGNEMVNRLLTASLGEAEADNYRTQVSRTETALSNQGGPAHQAAVETGWLADEVIADTYRELVPLLNSQMQAALAKGSPLTWP